MYPLFTEQERNYGGLLGDADLINIEKRTLLDVEHVVNYHRDGTFFTRTDHLLVKLINTIATPLSYPIDRYYEVTRARALYGANALQLSSAINRGKWFYGVFYHGCPELVLGYVEDFDLDEAVVNWKTLCPVQVLETPVSNLSYLVPTGIDQQEERGLAVIGINLGLLMVQYYSFMQDQYAKRQEDSSHSLLSTQHFVGRYVLPNMLYSQTDRALFNRMYNLQMGLPMGKATKHHPFMITDYASRLDKRLEIYLKRLTDSKRPYENYLRQLPSFFSDRAWQMPDVVETRQVWWLLFLTRMKDMDFLIDLSGKAGRNTNKHHLARLKIDIKRFNSDGIYKSVLPEHLLFKQQRLFSEWLSL